MFKHLSHIILIFPVILLAAFLTPGKILAANASFTLSPAVGTYAVGQTIPVNILLNTNGNNSSGASAIIIYDKLRFQVVSSSGALATSITAGTTTFPNPSITQNNVDTTVGQIRLDMTAPSSAGYFAGSGSYGTFYLKAISSGTGNVNFTFTQTGTTGSTVLAGVPAANVLGSVANAAFTITSAPSSSATPVASPLPDSGVVEPTIFILLGGIAIVFMGLLLGRTSEQKA